MNNNHTPFDNKGFEAFLKTIADHKEVPSETKPKAFAAENISVIPFIDPDSTRYAEWLWAVNNARGGEDVYLGKFVLDDEYDVKPNELMKEIKDRFNGSVFFSENYSRGLRINHVLNTPELYVTISFSGVSSIVVYAVGAEDEVEDIVNHFATKYKKPNTINVSILRGFENGRPNTTSRVLKESTQELAKDEFYPNIPQLRNGINYFIDSYLESKSNILLLWGAPGTGKSSFIRNILFNSNRKHYAIASDSVSIADPSFINWVAGFGDGSLIAIEDADLLVKSRENGNYQMSALLNFAEGIVKTDSKIIISTNLSSLKDIDSALIRKGRAFDVLEFKSLTPENANQARASIGKESVDYGALTNLTLSEALNWIDHKDNQHHQKGGGVGFY